LWQLIKAGAAQKTPHSGDTRIVPQLVISDPFGPEFRMLVEQLAQYVVRVRSHAAKLQAIKSLAVAPHATVAENDRPALPAQQDGDGYNQRAEDETKKGRPKDIEDPLNRLTGRRSSGRAGLTGNRAKESTLRLPDNSKLVPRRTPPRAPDRYWLCLSAGYAFAAHPTQPQVSGVRTESGQFLFSRLAQL
jgi:hypothetical protein